LELNSQKIVHISSSKSLNELSLIITENLGISGTIIKGNDLGDTEYKDIIFLMIDKNKLTPLKAISFRVRRKCENDCNGSYRSVRKRVIHSLNCLNINC
jgi:uncharacterized membrane-anchored protein YitT (DUF2179 family)